jgi:hypothetical protein
MNFPLEVRPKRLTLMTAGLLLLIVVSIVPGTAEAVMVNGSASVWGYMRNDSVKHTQLAPALVLNVHDFGLKDVRFESSLRGFTDMRGGKSEDRTLRLWRAVLIYTPQNCPWEVRAGQQWLSEGVGRGNVAGLWVKRKLAARSSITVYGGSRLPSALNLQDRFINQGFAVGLHGQSYLSHYRIGASYYYAGKDKNVLYQAAGVDVSGRVFSDLMARARLDINVERGSVEKAQLVGNWTPSERLDVVGEVRAQTPRVYEDSYFRIFLSEAATTYARVGASWYFRENLYLRGMGTMLFSDYPDPLYKAQAAIGHRIIEVGYTHWLSVNQSTWNGFFGQAKLHYSDKGSVFAGFDFARGSNAETNLRPADESQSVYFGANVTPWNALSLSAQAEQIKDSSHREWRGLFSIVSRFSTLK